MPRIADVDVDVESALERLGIEPTEIRGSWASALCPLHEEGKPSFGVHIDEGAWICRHVGDKGQLIDLVVAVRGCSRRDAALWLAKQKPKEYSAADVLERLYAKRGFVELDMTSTIKWAGRYDELDPDVMSEYWFERGFTAATMQEFEVRYDPDENALVWPVRDERANLLGFVRRRVPPVTGGAKYEYPKGFRRVLYPLSHFYGAVAVLVEGPLDALWLHQHGREGGLAALGSDLTARQVAWLMRNVTRAVMMFDSDKEGREGQEKAAGKLAGLNVLYARLPEGAKDAQELGPDELGKTIDSAVPAAFVLMGVE